MSATSAQNTGLTGTFFDDGACTSDGRSLTVTHIQDNNCHNLGPDPFYGGEFRLLLTAAGDKVRFFENQGCTGKQTVRDSFQLNRKCDPIANDGEGNLHIVNGVRAFRIER